MSEFGIRERTGVAQGTLVMPFYLICDVSGSMYDAMPALNEGLQRLRQAIVTEPVVDDVAQVSIMTFSDGMKTVMPMTQMTDHDTAPSLSIEGGTNYGAAFRGLAQAIAQDTAVLKKQGYKVFRPCAFFLTDGWPQDANWLQDFTSSLTYNQQTGAGMKSHPIFIPFGFRDAREEVLAKLAYPPERAKWYLVKNTSPEEALKGILDIIMKTVVTAGRTGGAGQPAIVQPAPVAGSGITQGDSSYDKDYIV